MKVLPERTPILEQPQERKKKQNGEKKKKHYTKKY